MDVAFNTKREYGGINPYNIIWPWLTMAMKKKPWIWIEYDNRNVPEWYSAILSFVYNM